MTTTKNRKVKATVIGFGTAAALLVGGTAAAQAATSPSPSASAGTDRQDGPGASLTTEQRAAFKKDMDALKSQRDAVFAKYGLKAPTRGDRGGVKDAVSKLSASQQAAFKKDMQALDAKRDAVFAKYGLTPLRARRAWSPPADEGAGLKAVGRAAGGVQEGHGGAETRG